MIRIQKEDFDIELEKKRLMTGRGKSGAAVIFIGIARDFAEGKDVSMLEFESYEKMALIELEKIELELKEKFKIDDLSIIHRTGKIMPGENIVMIIVLTAHRKEGFAACSFAIDELKKRVPIWKKEFTKDGSYWVNDRP